MVLYTDDPFVSNFAHVRYAKFDQLGNLITSNVVSTAYVGSLLYDPPIIKTDYLGNVHIVWSALDSTLPNQNNRNVFYTKLNNNGSFIVNALRLTNNINNYPYSSNRSYVPSLAIDDQNNVHIAWWFRSAIYNSNTSMFYTKLNQNLVSMVPPSVITSFTPLNSIYWPPAIFSDFINNIHFSFSQEVSPGNTEIYYKRSFYQPSIFIEGNSSIGSTIKFHIVDPSRSGAPYFLAFAFGNSPGIVLPDGRIIPLNYDDLLLLSLNNPASIGLSNNIGYLNNNGYANVTLAIPNSASLIGATFYAGFITTNTQATQIAGISPAINITIV